MAALMGPKSWFVYLDTSNKIAVISFVVLAGIIIFGILLFFAPELRLVGHMKEFQVRAKPVPGHSAQAGETTDGVAASEQNKAGDVTPSLPLRFVESSMRELSKVLRTQGGTVSIQVINADSYTERDAINLMDAFIDANWNTSGVRRTIKRTLDANGKPVPDPPGIQITASQRQMKQAKFVSEAIRKTTGIVCRLSADEDQGDTIGITVGSAQ
jgi:hypothetical protein